MKTGEIIYEKVFASPRPPLKISFKDNWMEEFGSEVAQRPDGQVVQQFQSSQLNRPASKSSVTQFFQKRHRRRDRILVSSAFHVNHTSCSIARARIQNRTHTSLAALSH